MIVNNLIYHHTTIMDLLFLCICNCLHSLYYSFFECQSFSKSWFRLLCLLLYFPFIFLFGMSYFSASRTSSIYNFLFSWMFPYFVEVWLWNAIVLTLLWQFLPSLLFENSLFYNNFHLNYFLILFANFSV